MAVETGFIIGYGGWATIQLKDKSTTVFIPLISGNVQKNINVSLMSSYDLSYNDKARSKIRMNSGVCQFNGSINFQITKNILDCFLQENSDVTKSSNFFMRKNLFDLQLCDGEKKLELNKCVWSNFSINVVSGQIVKGTLNFSSVNDHKENLTFKTATKYSGTPTIDDAPMKYWQFGNNNYGDNILNSFSITFSRNIQPIYLNNDFKTPTYFRVGMLDCTVQVTCLQDWFYYSAFTLGNKIITLLNTYRIQQNWQINGIQSQGYKTYIIKGSNNPTKQVFKITNNSNYSSEDDEEQQQI